MLNKNIYLNEELFNETVERVATRNGFGQGLVEAAEKNPDVVGLCCDLTESTRMHWFADQFPERFIEIGVAEQNLASVGSGMAAMGKIPFIASYAMFNPGRNWEQIRTTIAYNDVPVKIVGGHAGISVAQDGGTHQAIEDIAITRVIPRMQVVYPADHIQAHKATVAIANTTAPTYLRLAKQNTPVMTSEKTPFEIGKAQVMYETDITSGKYDICIITAGPVTHEVLVAARALEQSGLTIRVVNMHTIKPLDTGCIDTQIRECERIMTVEEHQRAGGLGSAVAEYVIQTKPTLMYIHGIDDRFGESGTAEELLEKHMLDAKGIKGIAQNFLKK